MTKARVDTSQCTARAKGSGERCRLRVVGGGVCRVHGRNGRVKANQEARAISLRAAAAYGSEVEERSPAEALLAAGRALDFSLQSLERMAGELGGGPMLLREIREAARESGRIAKLIQDAGLDERRLQVQERDQTAMGQVFELVLAAWGVDPSSTDVRETVAEALERVRAGDLSPLLSRVAVAPVLSIAAGRPEED